MKHKLILRNSLSPGDIVLLTAAVRDLHLSCPGRFLTDVRTSCPELWEHNPYLTPLSEKDPDVTVIECEIPLINQSNRAPYHAIHGFADFLSQRLGVPLRPLFFKGDIHLSSAEKSWFSQVHELAGRDVPFWIVNAGGKYDCTVKWWDARRYQAVVDHFRGRIQFVQVGAAGHHHPALEGVIDLRGQTSLRQLVRLVYHAQGVLCGITCLMHLATAIETRPGRPPQRACVVIAGGREPPQWEAYPHHQFLHTVGALPCCASGGCWRSRTVPLQDGQEFDHPENLCIDVVGGLPRCMHLISASDVIRKIELYMQGEGMAYLSKPLHKSASKAMAEAQKCPGFDNILTVQSARTRLEQHVPKLPAYPGGFSGRGIVVCGGGVKYFPPAWVCINLLRELGCRLPIQLWFLGERELSPDMKRLLAPLDVEFIDAEIVQRQHPVRILRGWELKAFALAHCRFREVLLLDSDNVPVANPEALFDTLEYKRTGAIFWPDVRNYQRKHSIWRITGIPFRPGAEFESGQIVIEKERCWRPLSLALWFNEHSDFFYRYILGDKETFYLAFRKLGHPYAMPEKRVRRLPGTMCQHNFRGARVFQHRNTDKWNIWLRNRKVKGFEHDGECRRLLRQLRQRWDGGIAHFNETFGLDRSSSGMAAPTPPVVVALLFSSPEYACVHERTVHRLKMTDWDKQSIGLVIVASKAPDALWHSARQVLRSLCALEPDYLLILGQNLRFNRSLRANLMSWEPLQLRRQIIASLSNSGVPADACDIPNHCFAAYPKAEHQSHAFLITRQSFHFLVNHWTDDDQHQPGPLVARLAAKLNQPVLYHTPSLVRSNSASDLFLGESADAQDYSVRWRRPVRAASC